MKKVDFSETIAGGDLNLTELMKIYVSTEGQIHFLTLAQWHLHMKIKLAFLSNHWAIFSQILNVICRPVQGNIMLDKNGCHAHIW